MNMNKIVFILLFLVSFSTGAQTIEKWKIADLEEFVKKSETPVVINFWATFCKPCLEELPYFQQLAKKYEKDGVKLILVSLDLPESYPKKISEVAAKRKFNATIKFLDESDADVFCPKVDESWSGSIPATLFVNNKNGYRRFFEDELTKEKFEQELIALISPK
jgi:thiol-disulfide isomerase/thioredoxin